MALAAPRGAVEGGRRVYQIPGHDLQKVRLEDRGPLGVGLDLPLPGSIGLVALQPRSSTQGECVLVDDQSAPRHRLPKVPAPVF